MYPFSLRVRASNDGRKGLFLWNIMMPLWTRRMDGQPENIQPLATAVARRREIKTNLNCHCILAADTPGRSLILALIQSHNNRGEISLRFAIDVPSLPGTDTIKHKPCFHNITALPCTVRFFFLKGQHPSKKGDVSLLLPVSVLNIHFISQYHYKI